MDGERVESQLVDLCLSQPLDFSVEVANNKLECDVYRRNQNER